jgi:hypothetical protein
MIDGFGASAFSFGDWQEQSKTITQKGKTAPIDFLKLLFIIMMNINFPAFISLSLLF